MGARLRCSKCLQPRHRFRRKRIFAAAGVSPMPLGLTFSQSPALSNIWPTLSSVQMVAGVMSKPVFKSLVSPVISDLNPGAIESLATAMQVIADFEKMPPNERKALVEQLAILEQGAARYGVSVGNFVRIMLGGDDGESPDRFVYPAAMVGGSWPAVHY